MRNFRTIAALAFALAIFALPRTGFAQLAVGVSVTLAPPALPIYAQPPLPAPGYIWTPGYWGYGPSGYYWVPGTWVLPPTAGLLWTPGYWGWVGGAYVWHVGYWGPQVGFYGGINYGFGYPGTGYFGGRWRNGVFAYNSVVNNIRNVHVPNVYRQAVVNRATSRVSFNGGAGGTRAQPSAQERSAGQAPHAAATALQTRHEQGAGANHALLATVNHGRPAVAATSRAGVFSGPGTVAARAPRAPVRPAAAHAAPPGPARRAGGAPAQRPPANARARPSGGGQPRGGDEHHE